MHATTPVSVDLQQRISSITGMEPAGQMTGPKVGAGVVVGASGCLGSVAQPPHPYQSTVYHIRVEFIIIS